MALKTVVFNVEIDRNNVWLAIHDPAQPPDVR